jgi:uncharacterized protein YbaP (TraB family)
MNPKRNSIFIIAFAFALVASATCSNAATACIWRVTNAKAPCYLVGTIHALSGSDYPIPAAYDQAYRESKRLVFETYFDPQGDYGREFDKASIYPKGDGVQRHIHPKTWQIITTNLGNASIVGKPGWLGSSNDPHRVWLEHGIQDLRPWAITAIFYGIPGYSDEHLYYGVDNEWIRRGRSGKDLAGLETNEEHIDVMRKMNDVESELIFLEAIAFRDKMRPEFNQLKTAWKHGDTTTIWALNQRFRKLDPGADARLLDERNVRWVPKIRNEFNSGVPTSIVVGCAHMLGPNGLLALLQRNGYKFEQL